MMILIGCGCFALALACAYVLMCCAVGFPAWVRPALKKSNGPFVAEVWLEWEICRGSTMYRQSFHSQRMAAIFAKLYAVLIDASLPRLYRVDDASDDGPVYERHQFEIHFGVRARVDGEAQRLSPIFSSTMPGYAGFEGEHREAHPLLALKGDLAGFQV
jgi:hypothetical protein